MLCNKLKMLYTQMGVVEIFPFNPLRCKLCNLSLEKLSAICDKIHKIKFDMIRKETFGHPPYLF
jgi:hypothetical protein